MPRTWTGFALLIAAGLIAWWILAEGERRADWIEGEGPEVATVGESFPVRLRLLQTNLTGRLGVSLRWTPWDRDATRSMDSGGGAAIEPGRVEYEFDLPVRDMPDIAFVYLVVYTSPSGGWADRARWASAGPIPARRLDAAEAKKVRERPLRLRLPDVRGGAVHPESSRGLRIGSGFVLSIAGVAGLVRWRSWRRVGGSLLREARWLGWGATLCLMLACWEFLDLGNALGEASREWARRARLYSYRGPAQHVASVVAVTLGLWIAAAIGRAKASGGARFAVSAGLVYGALCVMAAISLHRFDQLAAVTWAGYPAAQVVKAALAAGALAGFMWARGRNGV